jgi:hypothetical protein
MSDTKIKLKVDQRDLDSRMRTPAQVAADDESVLKDQLARGLTPDQIVAENHESKRRIAEALRALKKTL